MTDITLVGEKIRRIRCAKKLTQNTLAERLNVSSQAVSNWETGNSLPDIDNLIGLSDNLGVTVDYLLRSSESCMLAVDGGGTKTDFTVFTPDGNVLMRHILGASNPNDGGIDRSFEILSAGIDACLIGHSGISKVFCAIAGAGAGNNKTLLLSKLKSRYKNISFAVDSDAPCSLYIDKSCPIALICGTGVVVFVKNGSEISRVGGWGYLFDRAGSAYDIGCDAVRAALAELDGIGPRTLIKKLLEEEFGRGIWDNLGKLYSEGKTYIASLAPFVFKAYEMGDKTAYEIIDGNMKRVAELCNTAVKRFGIAPRVIAGGGLFDHHSDVMLSHLKKYTDSEFIFSPLPPVFGTCRRCMETFSEKEGDDFLENFKNTYK